MKMLKIAVLITSWCLSFNVFAEHIRSDGFGGFYTDEGHVRDDGFGGYYLPMVIIKDLMDLEDTI